MTDIDITSLLNYRNPLNLLDVNARLLHGGHASQIFANQEREIARPMADGALAVTGVPLGSVITTSGSLLDDTGVIDTDIIRSLSVNRLFQDIAKPNGLSSLYISYAVLSQEIQVDLSAS